MYFSVLHCCHVQLFAAPWTVACQAPLSMEFSRQEYWNVLPFSIPGNAPYLGTEPTSLASPALASGFFTTSATLEAQWTFLTIFSHNISYEETENHPKSTKIKPHLGPT